MSALGCTWVEGKKTVGRDVIDVFCDKLPERGKLLCPKHLLMKAETEATFARRAEASQLRRAHKAEQEKVLAASPLAAVNPKFDDKAKTYTEAE